MRGRGHILIPARHCEILRVAASSNSAFERDAPKGARPLNLNVRAFNMQISRVHSYVYTVVGAAIALHAYEQCVKSADPSFGWLIWSLIPYALCLFVLSRSASSIPAALGVSVALAFDFLAHYEVFVSPTSSTAALALLFGPLWNMLLFSPLTMLAAWLAVRRRRSS